jgi:hypothetical protein
VLHLFLFAHIGRSIPGASGLRAIGLGLCGRHISREGWTGSGDSKPIKRAPAEATGGCSLCVTGGDEERLTYPIRVRKVRLVPASPAVPTATEKKQHNDDDDEECRRIHVVLRRAATGRSRRFS